MNVALVGAIDRYNYGDVLFPIIVEEALKSRISDLSFEYFGYKESDLSKYNAKTTKNIKKLSEFNPDVIVIVGGQVLAAPWSATYLHLLDNYCLAHLYERARQVLGNRIVNHFSKYKLKASQKMPWIFEKANYPDSKIIYNTVGGGEYKNSFRGMEEYYKKALNDSDFISVRNIETKKNLESLGVRNVEEFPDSAFLMSNLYPLDYLQMVLERNSLLIENDYIVFQIAEEYSKGNIEEIVKQLSRVLESTNLSIVLLSIGQVALHEDSVPLKSISEIMIDKGYIDRIIFLEEKSVFEIMGIIANSCLFIGTSLHGNVTALSYGKPSVGLDKRVIKLTELLKSNSVEEQVYAADYENIYSSIVESLAIDPVKLKNKSIQNIDKVNRNFDLIAESIIDKRV